MTEAVSQSFSNADSQRVIAFFASIGHKLNSAIPQTLTDFEVEPNFSIYNYPCKAEEIYVTINEF